MKSGGEPKKIVNTLNKWLVTFYGYSQKVF